MFKHEFKILRSENVKDIEKEVTDHLNDGWELAGPMKIAALDSGYIKIWQPVILYDLEDDKIHKPDWWDGEK